MQTQTKKCQNCKAAFAIEPRDFEFYASMDVPPPTFCPPCRLQRRLAWRNERALYQRPCALCGKTVVALQHPESKLTTYCNSCWWSDGWNALEYGRDYDFSRPFFEQFRDLMHQVPEQSLFVMYATLVNSEYNNMNHYLKNCYLLFNSDYAEDCMYGTEVEHSKECVDVTMVDECELTYQSVNCFRCYQTYFSVDCLNCTTVWFSKNCSSCSDCFGCVNLKNKQYYIFNKPFTKEEYHKKLKEFNVGSYVAFQKAQQQAREYWLKFPFKYMHGTINENVSGDYIHHSKNVHDSFIVVEAHNCRYCMWLIVKNNKNCYDYTQFGEDAENMYESAVCGKGTNTVIGGYRVLGCHSIRYSMHCYDTNDLFGCIGVHKQKYCILNKQYTKEEYNALVPKIIQHMKDMPFRDEHGRVHTYGDYFPIALSPYAYNESTAIQFFPLTKEEALAAGYSWKDDGGQNKIITLPTSDLPDAIADATDGLEKEIIGCSHGGSCNHQCTRAFKITAQELSFYKKNQLPLPRLCPNCRHYERVQLKNGLALWQRKCNCSGNMSVRGTYKNVATHAHGSAPCKNEFQTTFRPEQKEIVYCEACYQKEVE